MKKSFKFQRNTKVKSNNRNKLTFFVISLAEKNTISFDSDLMQEEKGIDFLLTSSFKKVFKFGQLNSSL